MTNESIINSFYNADVRQALRDVSRQGGRTLAVLVVCNELENRLVEAERVRRYVRTENAGAFSVQVWARDPDRGEVRTANGTVVRCQAHAATADGSSAS